MKADIKLPLLLLMAILIGCKDFINEEKHLTLQEYGNCSSYNESRSIELQLHQFKNVSQLFNWVERIVCNDSTPKITLKLNKGIKVIYFQNLCLEKFDCLLIRERNIFRIHNDTVVKGNKSYPVGNLPTILKKDIENHRRDPAFSDHPEKLLIRVSYDMNEFQNLPNTVNLLVESYEAITNKRDIGIWLGDR